MNPYKKTKEYIIYLDKSSKLSIIVRDTHYCLRDGSHQSFYFSRIANCIICALCLFYESIDEPINHKNIFDIIDDINSILSLIPVDRNSKENINE